MEFQLRQSSSSYETSLLRKEIGREKPCGVQGAENVILGLSNDENQTGFTLLGTVSIALEGEVRTSILQLLETQVHPGQSLLQQHKELFLCVSSEFASGHTGAAWAQLQSLRAV